MIIKNLWKNTEIFCDSCGKRLELRQTDDDFLYKCPGCGKHIRSDDFEKVLDRICELEEKRISENAEYSFEGTKFRIGKNRYTIVSGDDYEWKLNAEIS